jgi:hypothetical protein
MIAKKGGTCFVEGRKLNAQDEEIKEMKKKR